ncbi:hypothetical protein PC129_g11862 [Phytophthora cactorum]|uniref:RxLR effector protein n=1 Tax=Phytophthora cactorum TaxID=29920 RepID=A0A329T2Z4_9STRA|nr:hypothetical protein Pcac1_g4650 [Phytophthora cactorum]KAG2897034.1 hypothetical protein PC114_g14823 [Phytophthora cactorum]KAG2911185.1 hypothetical protein PC115_g12638 [Phytophthora cactorum]KAG2928165.1 hypothetical protein PC117_g14377 [Phytophthora cactorum]KAG3154576.1 hypothetical protein C6341_g15649 [Phytophthora cactorum]
MRNFLLLLVLAFVAFTSGRATAHRPQLKVSKPELAQAAQWSIDDKRFLRATNAADEERGMTELMAKLKAWLQKFKSWFTKSKPVQKTTAQYQKLADKTMAKYQTLVYKREVTSAEDLIKKGVADDVLYQNKISPEAYFDALKLDPKLKFISDSPVVRANNPNLEKFLSYSSFWTGRKEVARAEDLIKKGVVNDVLYQNKISPEAYFDALKLDPKLKFISDSPVVRANNPNLEKFLSYSSFWTGRKEVARAEDLIKKGVVNDVLYQNKISPEAYFGALKLDPKLRFISDSPAARANNPNLEKFFSYSSFFYKSQAGKREVAKAEDLIKKGVADNVLIQNKISPEAYFEALKLDSRLKVVADSAHAWANNPGLEKFYKYSTKYYKNQAGNLD